MAPVPLQQCVQLHRSHYNNMRGSHKCEFIYISLRKQYLTRYNNVCRSHYNTVCGSQKCKSSTSQGTTMCAGPTPCGSTPGFAIISSLGSRTRNTLSCYCIIVLRILPLTIFRLAEQGSSAQCTFWREASVLVLSRNQEEFLFIAFC